jgi:hypothetical protein
MEYVKLCCEVTKERRGRGSTLIRRLLIYWVGATIVAMAVSVVLSYVVIYVFNIYFSSISFVIGLICGGLIPPLGLVISSRISNWTMGN